MKKIIVILFVLVLFMSGCQTKTEETSSEPNPSIIVRNITQLDEMRAKSMIEDEEEIKVYLRSVEGGGARSREDLISFVNLVDSLPIVKLIEGKVIWISHQKGESHNTQEYYNVVYISTESSNGDWTRLEYLLSVEDVPKEIERRKGEFAKSMLDNPIQVREGRIKVYSEIREKHPSGNGDTITWVLDVDGFFTRVVYFTNDINSVNTEDMFANVVIQSISEK